jgi:hypothetical protein
MLVQEILNTPTSATSQGKIGLAFVVLTRFTSLFSQAVFTSATGRNRTHYPLVRSHTKEFEFILNQ